MIKNKNDRRDFIARNHTILTGFRHKQKQATLIITNKKDCQSLISKNIIIYISHKQAALNYYHGRQIIPFLEKNFIKLYAKTKKNHL